LARQASRAGARPIPVWRPIGRHFLIAQFSDYASRQSLFDEEVLVETMFALLRSQRLEMPAFSRNLPSGGQRDRLI